MEKRSGLSELSVILWVSTIEGCPLSGVPLYMYMYINVLGGGSLTLDLISCIYMYVYCIYSHIFPLSSQSCDSALVKAAAADCLVFLSQYLGHVILRGRIEQHNPE